MDMPFLSMLELSRRRTILSAVAKVLTDKRKHVVEMQEVLEQSEMRFEDIVEEFNDLDDVLLSLVGCVSEWISEPVVSGADCPNSSDDLLDGLTEFGRRYAQANSTILPGIFRVFLTEGSRRSKLQKEFYAAGPKAIETSLVDFLQRAKSAAISDFPPSDLVAEGLMGLLREPLYRELAIHSKHLSPVLSSTDHVADIVRVFVKGCAGGPGR